MRRTSFLAHIALLAVVAIWGSTFVLVKAALRDCTPLLFNQVRMTLAFVVLAVVNLKHLRTITLRKALPGAVVGVLLAAGYELQTAGLVRTTPAKSAFLTGLVVVLVPLLGAIPFLRMPGAGRLGWPPVAGAMLAFCGIMLLTTPAGTSLSNLAGVLASGDILSVLCAFAFALHLLSIARVTQQMPAGQLATLQIGFCALAMTITTPLIERPQFRLTSALVLAWLITAVFATALAFSVQSWAQQRLPPAHTALLLSLEPAFAWLLSLLLWQEHLDRRSAAGALAILGGLLLSELLGTAKPLSEQPEANA